MPHINAIMQNHQVQKLSASDTSNAIRRCANVTDVLTSRGVTLIHSRFFQPPANLMHFQLRNQKQCARAHACVSGETSETLRGNNGKEKEKAED